MSLENKLIFVLDTCVLTSGADIDDFVNFSIPHYEELIGLIERHELENIEIFIPEIVLLELKSHRYNQFEQRISDLKRMTKFTELLFGFNPTSLQLFDIDSHINTILDRKKIELKLIPIPENRAELFDTVLGMALTKQAPFKNGEKDSDKGFKDAILYLSLERFAMVNQFRKMLFFTTDQGFIKGLQDRFKKSTGRDIEIIISKDVQSRISEIYDLFQDFKKYLGTQFYPNLDEKIVQLSTIFIHSIPFSIDEISIDHAKTYYTEVSNIEYDLVVGLNLQVFDDYTTLRSRNIDDVEIYYTISKDENNTWNFEMKSSNYTLI